MILLKLVPLLIIALGYGMWSRERERGTLRQVLSTGVSRTTLSMAKSCADGAHFFLLMPASIVVLAVLSYLGGFDAQTLWRLLGLCVAYGIYFSILQR